MTQVCSLKQLEAQWIYHEMTGLYIKAMYFTCDIINIYEANFSYVLISAGYFSVVLHYS